jgi:hypothetical protein
VPVTGGRERLLSGAAEEAREAGGRWRGEFHAFFAAT